MDSQQWQPTNSISQPVTTSALPGAQSAAQSAGQSAGQSMGRYIIIAARTDMPQANALAAELRKAGFQAAIASDVTLYIPYASAIVAMLAPTTLYQQPVVSAVNARPPCLIPVLVDSIPVPPGPWTSEAIVFGPDVPQTAASVVRALAQGVQQHPELAMPVTPLPAASFPAPPVPVAAFPSTPFPVPMQRPATPTPAYVFVSNAGNAVVTFSGVAAVISFFALPYISAGAFGSYTGIQVTNLINSLYSAASEFSPTTYSSSGPNPSLLLWAEVILAALAAGTAAWQWYKSNDSGDPPSRGATVFILIAAAVSAAILLYQYVGLQSSALGQAFSSLLGFGYWLMVLAMLVAVGGAIAQLRAFSAAASA